MNKSDAGIGSTIWVIIAALSEIAYGLHQNLSKDYQYQGQTSKTMLDIAATRLMLIRLVHA